MYREIRLGTNWFRWEPPNLAQPRNLEPKEKIALDRKNQLLTEKAETRQTVCWACGRTAVRFVREVGFDFKSDRADKLNHIAISSADYSGPVPGFCRICASGTGPASLALEVYWDRPEMQMGVKPDRWFVVFTDGMVEGGDCLLLDPKQLNPRIIETHTNN